MESGSGCFFGIGMICGEFGYYFVLCLVDDNWIIGVVVIKVSLEQLEKLWSMVEVLVMVVDENGVVIFGLVVDWKFMMLCLFDEMMCSVFDQIQ